VETQTPTGMLPLAAAGGEEGDTAEGVAEAEGGGSEGVGEGAGEASEELTEVLEEEKRLLEKEEELVLATVDA